MKRLLPLVFVFAVLVFAAGARADADSAPHYYLALGDSVTQGYQPIGGPWSPSADPGFNHGYPEELVKLVRSEYGQLRLENLACGGESSRTLIEGDSFCSYSEGSQLAQAEAFLEAHAGDVDFVTITIGGNDVIGREADCLDDATITIDFACVQGQLPSIQANIAEIVRRLQMKAPGVTIVGSNYYNPLLGAWVLVPSPIGQFLAQASVAPIELLGAGVEATYAATGAEVADIYEAFDGANFADQLETKNWGTVPVNVANACAWTWFCSTKYLGDVHPNNEGHAVIAQAFADVLS